MVTNTSLAWDSVASVSDSSDYGYDILERELGTGTCGSYGRESERWRYQHEDAIAARSHALADPTFIDPCSLGLSADMIPSEPTSGFQEIDRQLLFEKD